MPLLNWDTVKKEEVNSKIWKKVLHTEKMTFAQFGFAKGGAVSVHQHENEQIAYMIEGAIKFTVNGEEIIARKGDVLHIPANVPHGGEALEDSIDIEVFCPVRSDWLAAQK